MSPWEADAEHTSRFCCFTWMCISNYLLLQTQALPQPVSAISPTLPVWPRHLSRCQHALPYLAAYLRIRLQQKTLFGEVRPPNMMVACPQHPRTFPISTKAPKLQSRSSKLNHLKAHSKWAAYLAACSFQDSVAMRAPVYASNCSAADFSLVT